MAREKTKPEKAPEFIHTGLPEWMVPPKTHEGPPYTEHHLEFIFEKLSEGNTYASLQRDYPELPTRRELMKFLRKNQHLYEEYLESQRDGSETLVDMAQDLSNGVEPDGSPCMDDVPRLRERIGMIKWIAAARHTERYGEKRQIDVNSKVDLTDALRMADERAKQHRLSRGVTIDGEVSED